MISEAYPEASWDRVCRRSDRWAVVAADRNGGPLVRVSTSNGQLLMQVGAPADSFVAAASVRALLGARAGEPSHPDQEILRTPPEILADRSRSAAAVEADAWRRAEGSDGRWLWLAAAILWGSSRRCVDRRHGSRKRCVMPRDARVRSELVLTDFLTGLARRLQVVDAVRAARAALLAAAGAILGTAALRVPIPRASGWR